MFINSFGANWNFAHCIICHLDFRSGGEWLSLAKWRYLPSLCLQSGMFYELNKYNKRGDTSLPCEPKTDHTRSLKHFLWQLFINHTLYLAHVWNKDHIQREKRMLQDARPASDLNHPYNQTPAAASLGSPHPPLLATIHKIYIRGRIAHLC